MLQDVDKMVGKNKKRVSSARSQNKILREEKKFLNQIKNLDEVMSKQDKK
jgi:hypothetical protein